MTEIFNTLLIHPIINALVAIYKSLMFLGIPFAFGFSIILITVLVKLVTYPLTNLQIKSMKRMQDVKPHLDRIRELYKTDRMRQQQEMAALYKEHNINPAAGCLPILIQMPLLIGLYNVLFFHIIKTDTVTTVENINKVLYLPILHLDKAWDVTFFAISLVATPLGSISSAPFLLLVPIITAALQFIQSKTMTPVAKSSTQTKSDDFQKIMQTQMIYIFPVMIGFFSFSLPVGLSLYWNTFTVFGIIQQTITNRKDEKRRAEN